jgi:hypothetical protein
MHELNSMHNQQKKKPHTHNRAASKKPGARDRLWQLTHHPAAQAVAATSADSISHFHERGLTLPKAWDVLPNRFLANVRVAADAAQRAEAAMWPEAPPPPPHGVEAQERAVVAILRRHFDALREGVLASLAAPA